MLLTELDPTPHLDAVEELIASLLNGTCSLVKEHQFFFLSDALPAIVRLLSHRRLPPKNSVNYSRAIHFQVQRERRPVSAHK